MNLAAERLTGYGEVDAQDKQLTDIFKITNEQSFKMESPAAKAFREGASIEPAEHVVLIARDGGEWPIDDSAALIFDSNGSILSLMCPPAMEQGLELGITFQGSIPRLVQSDPSRLRQIPINLLGNTAKTTESETVDILLRTDVIDSRIGMTTEQIERLIRPFTQGDESITRKFRGTGMGVTISRQMPRLLGGDVTVTSRPRVGSTFAATVDCGPQAGVERLCG